MKNFVFIAFFLINCFTVSVFSQEMMVIQQKSGRTVEFSVSDIEQVYFRSLDIPDTDGDDTPGVHNGHQYVDLGLPSGTLWATCNIGAENPEEDGHYFAWGETSPKSVYNEETYKYAQKVTDSDGFDSYEYYEVGFQKEGLNSYYINGTEYDAAHVNWGGSWMMPTEEQLRELFDNCEKQYVKLNGVYGYKLISKAENNDGWIFITFSGRKLGSSKQYRGSYIEFWKRSAGLKEAFYFNLNAEGIMIHWGNTSKVVGRTVRPVFVR